MLRGQFSKSSEAEKVLEVAVEELTPADRWNRFGTVERDGLKLAFYGQVFGSESGFDSEAQLLGLLDGYRQQGLSVFAELDGAFVAAVCDMANDELWLVRDHLGVETLYFRVGEDGSTRFATSLRSLVRSLNDPEALDPAGLATYLLLNYNPGQTTFFQGIYKVPPGSAVRVRDKSWEVVPYWRPDYGQKLEASEERIAAELREELDKAVRVRVASDRSVGFSVSGGMDSSTVLGLASKYLGGDFYAFSFRCAVQSYDESHYSSLIAKHYGARYEQVEYTPELALLAAEMVKMMDEPQADLGIEVATFLLGRHAEGKIDLLLTGDGGDELFAGHPVYLADRAAQRFERIPSFLRVPVVWAAALLPESDRKNALTVKLRRFVQGQQFPRAFHSNRWRIYYTPDGLRQLLTDRAWRRVRDEAELDWLKVLYRGLPWPEELDRALYGDYFTVVQFYLRRLSLLRSFGIEARCPLLDPRLVEYCARIPNRFKIPNSKEQKYIQKKAMEGILPDEIVHRKDKLGHSVPMRKWLREEKVLIDAIRDALGPDSRLVTWGLVRPEAVKRMMEENRTGKENHAHRLWALFVLELWLRSFE